MKLIQLLIIVLLFISHVSFAQEEAVTTLQHGRKYVELNLSSLEKYNNRIQREQKRLLNRLSKKENKLRRKLKKDDSVQYASLQHNPSRTTASAPS